MCNEPVEVDVLGQITRKLEGAQAPVSGKTLKLAISAELQRYAEELLVTSEKWRDEHFAEAGKDHQLITAPWVKGGAIIAMIPQTGEVVASATYPRYDPNDFTSKTRKIHQWLETEHHISSIWDGKAVLEKEWPNKVKQTELSWTTFLDRILSKQSTAKAQLSNIKTIKAAKDVLSQAELLLHFSGQSDMATLIDTLYANGEPSRKNSYDKNTLEHLNQHLQVSALKKQLSKTLAPLKYNDDKLLVLDLLSLIIDPAQLSEELIDAIGFETLDHYKKLNQAVNRILGAIEKQCKTSFHTIEFTQMAIGSFYKLSKNCAS